MRPRCDSDDAGIKLLFAPLANGFSCDDGPLEKAEAGRTSSRGRGRTGSVCIIILIVGIVISIAFVADFRRYQTIECFQFFIRAAIEGAWGTKQNKTHSWLVQGRDKGAWWLVGRSVRGTICSLSCNSSIQSRRLLQFPEPPN